MNQQELGTRSTKSPLPNARSSPGRGSGTGGNATHRSKAAIPGRGAYHRRAALFTARLTERFGPRAALIPGVVLIATGLLLFARTPTHGNYRTDILPAVALLGAGAGLTFPSLVAIAMSATSPEESGIASGLVNTSLQLGGALGLAVLATVATQRTEAVLATGRPVAESLNSGYHVAYIVAALLQVSALVIALVALRTGTSAKPSAATTD